MNNSYHYPGYELSIFEKAVNWKKYFAKKILPFITGDVLEVGAGIGGTTNTLNKGSALLWVMLEPDKNMYEGLLNNKASFPANTSIQLGTIDSIAQKFDTILYIDVLEHIREDAIELRNACTCLRKSGHLVVLSPAFDFLYSEFDKAIGHYKRYKKRELQKISPPGMKLVCLKYLDALGFFASAANKLFLHQAYPSGKQIRFWDKYLVPISTAADPIFLHLFGKSILAIWENTNDEVS